MPGTTGTGGVQAKKLSLAGSGRAFNAGSGGVQTNKPYLSGVGIGHNIGSGGVQTKKPNLAGSGLAHLAGGAGGVHAKKAFFSSPAASNVGHGVMFAKKAHLAGTGGPKIKGSGGVHVKKPFIFGTIRIVGTGGMQARKPSLQGGVHITGTGSMQTKKLSLAGWQHGLITVNIGGVWRDATVFAMVNGVWVPALPKVRLDGVWYAIQLGEPGFHKVGGGVQVKKPRLAGTGGGTVKGSGGVQARKPRIQGSQRVTILGSGSILVNRPRLHGIQATPNNFTQFGVNAPFFQAYKAVISHTTITRVYGQSGIDSAGIPINWPITASMNVGADNYVVSFRPTDISGFIAGTYDASVKAWLRKVPAGTFVCVYHEANLPSNIFQATLGGTAAQHTAMTLHLHDLAQQVGNGVLIGSLLGTASPIVRNSPWIVSGLDFYALDGYSSGRNLTASERFEPSMDNIVGVAPDAVNKLAVAENNAKQSTTDQMWSQWFIDGFNIALDRELLFWMTWWGPYPQYPNAENFDPARFYTPVLQGLMNSL
jgi:hypothetical protein